MKKNYWAWAVECDEAPAGGPEDILVLCPSCRAAQDVGEAEKRCTLCRSVKSITAFPRNRRTKSGLASWCYACRNAVDNANKRIRDPDRRREAREAAKQAILERA